MVKNKIEIYTDGACKGNPGPGGWAFVILENSLMSSQKRGGPKEDTTNNKMELTAAIEALKSLDDSLEGEITIYSDSAYIVNCFNQKWYVKWKNNGWKGGVSGTIQNKDLWEELIALQEKHNVNFAYVKAHAGNEFNELVDGYASSYASKNRY